MRNAYQIRRLMTDYYYQDTHSVFSRLDKHIYRKAINGKYGTTYRIFYSEADPEEVAEKLRTYEFKVQVTTYKTTNYQDLTISWRA